MHQDHTTISAATRQPLGRRARTTLAVVATLLVALLGGVPSTGTATLDATTATRVVVEARDGLAAATQAVVRQGGRVVEVLAPFGMVVADVPTGTADDLAADPATRGVTPDVPMQVQSADGVPATPGDAAPASTSALPDAGEGVGVVVVDTGIAHHRDLGDRVVARYDYDAAAGRPSDRHGHGTFMAGLVAADGDHPGVAPGSHLVSVRVADDEGQTTLSTVLHGLVIADMAREHHDAPVVLLALSGKAAPQPDPLMVVLEMLWARGSTVVVAAGNSDTGAVASPGWDPFLLTAGALDEAAGRVPTWSGRGELAVTSPSAEELAWSKPDLVAPGVSTIGLRAPGSTIDRTNPDARIAGRYFLGSGTSMAAARTAGAAAAVLAANDDLTPDQVKGLLRATADPLADGGVADGDGVLDIVEAVEKASDGASYDGNEHVGDLPAPIPGAGELDPDGWSWDGWSWDGWSWDGWSWDGWSWDGWSWDGSSWDGWSWDGWSWDGWSWDGWSWDGWSWDGWSWDGWSWDAAAWGDGTA